MRIPQTVRPLALVAALHIPSHSVGAQLAAWLDVGASQVRADGDAALTSVSVGPSVRHDARHSTLVVSALGARMAGGQGFAQGAATLLGMMPLGPHAQAEAFGEGLGSARQDGVRVGQAHGGVRLHLVSQRLGGWAGASAGRAWDGVGTAPLATLDAGIWLRLSRTLLTLGATPQRVADSVRFVDALGSASTTLGPFELQLSAGRRLAVRNLGTTADSGDRGNGTIAWGGGAVAIWLANHLALTAAAGSYGSDPAQGFPGGRYATVGVRLATRPPSVVRALRPDGSARSGVVVRSDGSAGSPRALDITHEAGSTVLRLHAPNASNVELMGDFTDWTPVPMTRQPDGRWTLVRPVPPGLRQLVVRMDGGAWQAPAGLGTTVDEFGATVGVVLVPARGTP